MFFWNSLAFSMIQRMLAIWSPVPLPFLASLMAQLIKNPPVMQKTPVQFLGLEEPLQKGQATHSSILGLPYGSAGKETSCNVGDLGSIPRLGRSPGEGKGYPLQYSGLENSMDCIGCKELDTSEWLSLSLYFLNPAWTSINSQFMCCGSLAWRILSIALLACEMSAIVW